MPVLFNPPVRYLLIDLDNLEKGGREARGVVGELVSIEGTTSAGDGYYLTIRVDKKL